MTHFRIPKLIQIIFFKRVWSLNPDNNTIYLTFDDGPHPDITPFVLDQLKTHNIKATFFCVADNVIKYPIIFQQIIDEGHQIGNHTFRHENALRTAKGRYLSSVMNASVYIRSKLFRPPYGRLTLPLSWNLAKKYKIIMWTWLSNDFNSQISVTQILENAKNQIKAGDIIVLHDNPKIAEKQKELLPKFLELLIQKEFNFRKID
jgi:peptidoglycan/xylan/chitin deacetylase (PgdA/CDA1 family)